MIQRKLSLTIDQWILFAILILLSLLSFAFEYYFALINLYSIVILKVIGLLFDGLIAYYYKKFRRVMVLIAKKHSLTYYLRETAPFLLVFGGAYALKIGFIAILSVFFPSLALSVSTVQKAILGMLCSTLAFAWMFRILMKWVYQKTRPLKLKREKKFPKD